MIDFFQSASDNSIITMFWRIKEQMNGIKINSGDNILYFIHLMCDSWCSEITTWVWLPWLQLALDTVTKWDFGVSNSVEFCWWPLKEGVAIMDYRNVTWINTVSASFDICKPLPKIYSFGANHFNTEILHVFLHFLSRTYFSRPIHILKHHLLELC